MTERDAANAPQNAAFLSQTALTLASQPLLLLLGAVSSVVIARALGPVGRGEVAAAAVGPALVVAFLSVGFGIGNVYFLSKREVQPAAALGSALVVSVGTSVIGIAIYLIGASAFRTSLLHDLQVPFVLVGALLIPASLFGRNILSVAQGLRRMALWNLASLISAAAVVALYVVTLVLLHLGALSALVAIVVATVLSVVIPAAWLWKLFPNWSFDLRFATRAIRFGCIGEAGNVLQLLVYRLDVLLVTALLGFAAAGTYTVAFTLSEILWQVPNAAGLILFPRVASGRGDTTAITARLVRLTLALLLIEGAVGAVLAPVLIPWIFSSRFEQAVSAFWLLLPGGVLLGMGKLISANLAGRGRPGLPSVGSAIAFVLTVSLDLSLIPRLGINGASIASSIAYTASTLFVLIAFVRLTGIGWAHLLVVQPEDWRFTLREVRQQVHSLLGLVRAR